MGAELGAEHGAEVELGACEGVDSVSRLLCLRSRCRFSTNFRYASLIYFK